MPKNNVQISKACRTARPGYLKEELKHSHFTGNEHSQVFIYYAGEDELVIGSVYDGHCYHMWLEEQHTGEPWDEDVAFKTQVDWED